MKVNVRVAPLTANYRPVALPLIICKVMETIAKDNNTSHISLQSFFTPLQRGFLIRRSTLIALLSVYFDWIQPFYLIHKTHCIFFNISKAFITLNNRKFVFKLAHYSIDLLCIAWIKVYLTNRTQKVNIKLTLSNHFIHCTSGVLQDSVISPIIFILFMNDLPLVILKV